MVQFVHVVPWVGILKVSNLEQPLFGARPTMASVSQVTKIVSHSPPSGAFKGLALGADLSASGNGTARDPLHADQEALDLERQRREIFVGTLAHELRQPLATMLAAVEVVRLNPGSSAATQAMEVVRRQIGQMDRVVVDLLDAARWARGKVTLRKHRLDLREIVTEAAADVAAVVASRGHELIVSTAAEPLWADVDPQRFHQVLSNLLRNAAKYTDPGGHITLSAQRDEAAIVVRVCDTGQGIPPDGLPHVFDLFAQLRPSEEGLGIGLSVVREIVGLHDGRIQARSEGLGNGSEFVVTLPLARSSDDSDHA